MLKFLPRFFQKAGGVRGNAPKKTKKIQITFKQKSQYQTVAKINKLQCV